MEWRPIGRSIFHLLLSASRCWRSPVIWLQLSVGFCLPTGSIAPLLHLASVGVFLDAFIQVSQLQLERKMDFKRLRILSAAGTILYTVTVLTFGFSGWGAAAIVLGSQVSGIPLWLRFVFRAAMAPARWMVARSELAELQGIVKVGFCKGLVRFVVGGERRVGVCCPARPRWIHRNGIVEPRPGVVHYLDRKDPRCAATDSLPTIASLRCRSGTLPVLRHAF